MNLSCSSPLMQQRSICKRLIGTMSGVPLVKQENNVISQEELEQKIEQSSLVLPKSCL